MNVCEIIGTAKRHGVEMHVDGDQLQVRAKRKPPEFLIEELRAHKPEILAFLRFGSLTPGGKVCRRCLTISLCRVLRAGFVCDGCLRDDDVPYPAALALVEAGGITAAMTVNEMLRRSSA